MMAGTEQEKDTLIRKDMETNENMGGGRGI
jgi:hypothetical protein